MPRLARVGQGRTLFCAPGVRVVSDTGKILLRKLLGANLLEPDQAEGKRPGTFRLAPSASAGNFGLHLRAALRDNEKQSVVEGNRLVDLLVNMVGLWFLIIGVLLL